MATHLRVATFAAFFAATTLLSCGSSTEGHCDRPTRVTERLEGSVTTPSNGGAFVTDHLRNERSAPDGVNVEWAAHVSASFGAYFSLTVTAGAATMRSSLSLEKLQGLGTRALADLGACASTESGCIPLDGTLVVTENEAMDCTNGWKDDVYQQICNEHLALTLHVMPSANAPFAGDFVLTYAAGIEQYATGALRGCD